MQRELRRFEAEIALLCGRVRSAASLAEVLSLVESLRVRSELRSMDRVRDERARLIRIAEARANVLVAIEVETLKQLAHTDERDEGFRALSRTIGRLRGLLSTAALSRATTEMRTEWEHEAAPMPNAVAAVPFAGAGVDGSVSPAPEVEDAIH